VRERDPAADHLGDLAFSGRFTRLGKSDAAHLANYLLGGTAALRQYV
jgi:hypothetical protein